MFEYIDLYLKGGTFLEERQWASIYKHNVKSAERSLATKYANERWLPTGVIVNNWTPPTHTVQNRKIRYHYTTQLHWIHKIVGNSLEYKQPCM